MYTSNKSLIFIRKSNLSIQNMRSDLHSLMPVTNGRIKIVFLAFTFMIFLQHHSFFFLLPHKMCITYVLQLLKDHLKILYSSHIKMENLVSPHKEALGCGQIPQIFIATLLVTFYCGSSSLINNSPGPWHLL